MRFLASVPSWREAMGVGGRRWMWVLIGGAAACSALTSPGVESGASRDSPNGTVDLTDGGIAVSTGMPMSSVRGRVDFADVVPNPKSMVGFLNGLSGDSGEFLDDALVAALRPQVWRGTPQAVPTEYAARFGSRYDLILSDLWGYPGDGWPRGRPWEQPAAFEEFVRTVVQDNAAAVRVWEVWNEPNAHGNLWDGTEEQFFETYLAAYRAIRAAAPSAIIAGPSPWFYDLGLLKRFADFCVANGCEVNVLTWHEMGIERPLSSIAARLRYMRQAIVDNPAYASLRISEIQVTEGIGPYETVNPAASLTYLQYLELGGASASARACWPDVNQVSSCTRNSLDGLLTTGTAQPRSVWWAYKAYADGADARVRSTISDERFVSLASLGAARGQVLLGYSNVNDLALQEHSPEVTIDLHLLHVDRIPGLERAARVRVEVSEIRDSGEGVSAGPEPVFSDLRSVVDGEASLFFEHARANAIYVVTIGAPS